MTRDIHLIFYPSPLFPAHWGLWIPSVGNPQIGKMVHVVGDVATGFEHQFKRNYSLITTTRRYDLSSLPKLTINMSSMYRGTEKDRQIRIRLMTLSGKLLLFLRLARA